MSCLCLRSVTGSLKAASCGSWQEGTAIRSLRLGVDPEGAPRSLQDLEPYLNNSLGFAKKLTSTKTPITNALFPRWTISW